MITGTVGIAREATVWLLIRGRNGRELETELIIDTGYNDDLTLPPDVVDALDLALIGPTQATVAGQVVVAADYYRAGVLWDGRARLASVLELEGAPLVGMGLLDRAIARR